MCGCDFDGELDGCRNRYPDCPALTDEGQNFGAGFYNDHHFHFGYHIYAAAGMTLISVH
jgi:endo-1,3(4)-beta-glucanase